MLDGWFIWICCDEKEGEIDVYMWRMLYRERKRYNIQCNRELNLYQYMLSV